MGQFSFTLGFLIETGILTVGAAIVVYLLIFRPSALSLESGAARNKYLAVWVISITVGLVVVLNLYSRLNNVVYGPTGTSCDSNDKINSSVECYVKWRKVVKVCMGNGGGNNCLSGTDVHYDCNFYNAIGGGGPSTTDFLVKNFCGYTDKEGTKVFPHNVAVIQNNGGGQCGWTAFQITCNP